MRAELDGIKRAAVLDDRTIRFDLKERTDDTIFTAAGLPVFSRKWVAGPDGTPKTFDEIVNEYPITTGPYTIARTTPAAASSSCATPTTGRATSAWPRASSTSTAIVYRYYQDSAVRMEAFKAGEFDFIQEFGAPQ